MLCRYAFTEAADDSGQVCAICGHLGAFEKLREDVELKITWRKLQILAEWATKHVKAARLGEDARDALDSILGRIRAKRPQGAPRYGWRSSTRKQARRPWTWTWS